MSTFAPTWSLGYEKRILKYRDKPDKETYARVRQFASDVLGSVAAGTTSVVKKEFHFSELIRGAFLVKAYKLLIHRHVINKKKCIDCGTCVEKCPTSSISLERHAIETGTCIACMGCVNNCPVRAIDMRITGKRVYGFNDFLKRNKIVIMEPEL
jgi:ferredoxin